MHHPLQSPKLTRKQKKKWGKKQVTRRKHLRGKVRGKRNHRSWIFSLQRERYPVQYQNYGNLRTPAQPIIYQDITKCQWLHYGAYVGNETRTIEFKERGEYLNRKHFSDIVLRYGCAFLNSEGGSLVFGVRDDGIVCGVIFQHQNEDQTRKWVDDAVTFFKPPLLPHNYSLRFLPVVKSGRQDHNLKVLCLTFKAPLASCEPILYSTGKGEVYLRRDGGVQGPLRLPVIVEWYKQMFPHLVVQSFHEVLSRITHFEDHRSMLNQIIALPKTGRAYSLQKSEGQNSTSSSKSRDQGQDFQHPVKALDITPTQSPRARHWPSKSEHRQI